MHSALKTLLPAALLIVLNGLSSCGYRVVLNTQKPNASPNASAPLAFFRDDFKARLDSARQSGKPVFLDFYTDWCGPCKVMDRDVFPDRQLADFFNSNFICLKINTEKGEGPALARLYNIEAYPTMIFLDKEGQERKRIIGLTTAGQLKKSGRTVLRGKK